MADPDAIPRLLPVFAALAGLLVAGLAAMRRLLLQPATDARSWTAALDDLARTPAWQGRDLLWLLLPVAAAQWLRHRFGAGMVGDVIAFQGALAAGILARAVVKMHPFGTPASWKKIAGQAVLRWLAILPALWLAAFLWQLVLYLFGHAPDLQDSIRTFLDTEDPGKRAAFVFFAVVLAPFTEEVLFRGVLLPLLVRRAGAAAGLVLTAIGFAALHGDAGTFVALALFSGALSLAYARTQSLWVPMGMHALFNGASLALMLALAHAGLT